MNISIREAWKRNQESARAKHVHCFDLCSPNSPLLSSSHLFHCFFSLVPVHPQVTSFHACFLPGQRSQRRAWLTSLRSWSDRILSLTDFLPALPWLVVVPALYLKVLDVCTESLRKSYTRVGAATWAWSTGLHWRRTGSTNWRHSLWEIWPVAIDNLVFQGKTELRLVWVFQITRNIGH